jgi:nitrogen-specific signal transduction histidine kinase
VDTSDAKDRLDGAFVLDAAQQQLDASADDLLRSSLEEVAQTAVNEALESLSQVVARRVKGRRYVVSVSEVGDPDPDGSSG